MQSEVWIRLLKAFIKNMQDKKFGIVMNIKIFNDKKIILFKTQKIQSETGSFQEIFTQELKKMEIIRAYNTRLIKVNL